MAFVTWCNAESFCTEPPHAPIDVHQAYLSDQCHAGLAGHAAMADPKRGMRIPDQDVAQPTGAASEHGALVGPVLLLRPARASQALPALEAATSSEQSSQPSSAPQTAQAMTSQQFADSKHPDALTFELGFLIDVIPMEIFVQVCVPACVTLLICGVLGLCGAATIVISAASSCFRTFLEHVLYCAATRPSRVAIASRWTAASMSAHGHLHHAVWYSRFLTAGLLFKC